MSVEYQPSALPSIGAMAKMPLKMEEVEYPLKKPLLPALATAAPGKYSHTHAHSILPPPQPRPTANSSVAPSITFMTSSTISRHGIVQEDGAQSNKTRHAQSHLSLPSIHEALARDSTHVPSSAASTHSSYLNASPKSPNFTWKPSHSDTHHTNNSRIIPQSSSRIPYFGHVSPLTPAPQQSYRQSSIQPHSEISEPQIGGLAGNQPQANASPSPCQSDAHNPSQSWPPQIPHQYNSYPQLEEPPYTRYTYAHSQSYPAHTTHLPVQPPIASSTNPFYSSRDLNNGATEHTGPWLNEEGDFSSSDNAKRRRGSYGDWVKKHLDVFDLESSLENIANSSKHVFDFSRHYSQRAHQTSRSGPLPGSTPNLLEIDDMVKHGHELQESLARLRDVVASQQAALARRVQEQHLHKAVKHPASDDGYQDGPRDGSTGQENKKRRGRAAPPGRCHSCNRAETPEWRRGPDGARTLCNACGLHYAKLTRKMGASKVPIGNSNLGLQQASPGSPSI